MFVDKKKETKPEISTGSMSDISFLLLIFFLVTTTLHSDKGLQLELPEWGDQKPIPRKNIMSILMNDEGLIMVNGEITPLASIKEQCRVATAANPNLVISLKPDNQTDYYKFVALLDQVQLSGAKKISIAEPEQ